MKQPLTLLLLIACGQLHSQIIFSDGFNYPNGALAGNNGGTGWTGAWTSTSPPPVNNIVTENIAGRSGKSVIISPVPYVTSRTFSPSINLASSTTYYFSFFFNAAPFSPANTGKYAGITLRNSATDDYSLFMGMPGSSGDLGFTWKNEGEGLFSTASDNTTYLVLFKTEKLTTPPFYTRVSFYATTNLSSDGNTLESSPVRAYIDGLSTPPPYNTIEISGSYDDAAGTIKIAGLCMATSANEAVARTQMGAPQFGNPGTGGAIDICEKGSYFLNPSTTAGTWGTSSPTVATVNSSGYVMGLSPGTATITYTVEGETTTALINVVAAGTFTSNYPSLGHFTDTKTAFKFNGAPQGPQGGGPNVNYAGYDGYSYAGQTPPTNVGFYRASKQSANIAGCPYTYYIFVCSVCPDL